jgi:hypothetical protein
MRYWINTVSRDHVHAGVRGGFTQADHGGDTRLKRLRKGDLVVFYSPRTQFTGGEPLKAFTAMGRIVDDDPFQVEIKRDFHPWRRRTAFFKTRETDIRPLIDNLSFIGNKLKWGFPFRRGLFEIPGPDFKIIAEAMGVDLLEE